MSSKMYVVFSDGVMKGSVAAGAVRKGECGWGLLIFEVGFLAA